MSYVVCIVRRSIIISSHSIFHNPILPTPSHTSFQFRTVSGEMNSLFRISSFSNRRYRRRSIISVAFSNGTKVSNTPSSTRMLNRDSPFVGYANGGLGLSIHPRRKQPCMQTCSTSSSMSPSTIDHHTLQQQQELTVAPASPPIDFDRASTIVGAESHALLVQLEPGQVLQAETGAMLFMTTGIDMNTSLGGNANQSGIRSGFQRIMTGQNLFLSHFTYTGPRGTKGTVGLGTDFPSKILRFSLKDYGHKLVCQKGAFLAGSASIQIEMEFTKNFMSGFFGSEGFILQALLGDGDVFCKAGGTIIKKELKSGETLRVSSGSLVAFTQEIHYDVQMMPGFKNVLFGGEGLFITTLQGPGIVWLQGLSPDRMISEIVRRMPSGGGMGIPIPIPLGGGGEGDASSTSTSNDESVSVPENVNSATIPVTSSPHDVPSNDIVSEVDSESPSSLFGDAIKPQTPSRDKLTDEHYTTTTANNGNNADDSFMKEDTFESSDSLPDEEFSEEESDHFEVEQTAGESQDDSPFGLLRKIWDFFKGDD